MSTKLISIAAAAKQVGVHRSTLSRQINAGLIRSYDGKVRLSEVVADRRSNIAVRPNTRSNISAACNDVALTRASLINTQHRRSDDAPIGPGPYTVITNIALTRGLVRELGKVIGEPQTDVAVIGEALISIGSNILMEEIRRLRAIAGEEEPTYL